MKKLNYKRPMMFYQHGIDDEFLIDYHKKSALFGPRIRIVYPCGAVEWCTLAPNFSIFTWDHAPCYGRQFSSPDAAIKAMILHDNYNKFPPMEFLGYL